MTVRTRFAPSPTGRLHLGNVRAAVFNWLFARHHGGAFVLRIEDTDTARNVAGGEEGILEDLSWLGLDWDEGPDVGGPCGPYRQSERGVAYAAAVEALLEAGRAYPCFCSDAELESDTTEGKDGRDVRRYSGRCRHLTAAERAHLEQAGPPPAIRFAVPGTGGDVEIADAVFGSLSVPREELDDFVVRRSDGRVTYNFAVVVDDIGMEITHVIRGVGHLSNIPKQALVFDALGRARPVFAHLPTVLGKDGRKLSKREGASAVAELRDVGYPPDAIVNYLSLLGWSHPEEREVLSREELVAAISLDRVGKSDTQMDPEKLSWMGGQHIATESLGDLARHVRPFVDVERFPGALDRVEAVVDVLRSRLSTYGEINRHLPLIYPARDEAVSSARAEVAADPAAARVLERVGEALAAVEPWEADVLSSVVRDAGARAGARGAGIFHPLRVALIGSPKGPDLGKILAALGREEALGRIRAILGGRVV